MTRSVPVDVALTTTAAPDEGTMPVRAVILT